MASHRPARCGACCMAISIPEDAFDAQIAVCAACAQANRFSADGGSLALIDAVELAALPEPVREHLEELRREARAVWGDRALPPGYSWGTGTLCGACWKELEPVREPARLRIPEPELCTLCGSVTRSGIYRRMLVPSVLPQPAAMKRPRSARCVKALAKAFERHRTLYPESKPIWLDTRGVILFGIPLDDERRGYVAGNADAHAAIAWVDEQTGKKGTLFQVLCALSMLGWTR